MLIGMLFRCMLVVLGSVKRMAVRDFGMVCCFFMMPGGRMLSGFFVMPGGMFVMFGSFLMVFVNCVLFHDGLPVCTNSEDTLPVYQRHDEENVTPFRDDHRPVVASPEAGPSPSKSGEPISPRSMVNSPNNP
jgi:hypothetical protein